MNVLVIHESLTGTTRRAAELIASGLSRAGATAAACPVTAIDFAALSAADLVVVGSWTDGFVFVGQRPGRAGRLRKLPVMQGKRAVVFCTYAVDVGHTLEKLSAILAERGADVLGGMTVRRDRVTSDVDELVNRIVDVALPA